jgi:hypothetical protein
MSDTTYWVVALVIGLAAALIVTALLLMLLRSVASIEKSVGGLLTVATGVAGNTSNIPQLEATAPVLAAIVDEAVVQDGYMNALTDGFGDGR